MGDARWHSKGSWVKVKVTQSCPTLCNPMDCTAHGTLQAGMLEWVAIAFSRGPSQPRDQTGVSHIAGRFFTSGATGKPPLENKCVVFVLSSGLSRVRICLVVQLLKNQQVGFLLPRHQENPL